LIINTWLLPVRIPCLTLNISWTVLSLPKTENELSEIGSITVNREYKWHKWFNIAKWKEIIIDEIIFTDEDKLTNSVRFHIVWKEEDIKTFSLWVFMSNFCIEMLDKEKRHKVDIENVESKISKLEKVLSSSDIEETIEEKKNYIDHIIKKLWKLFLGKKSKKK